MIRQDLRYAVRMFAANPAFTAVAILSLALGIGANTAIFSLLNSVMFSTLPVRDPHELVILTNPNAAGAGIGAQGGDRGLMTYPEYRDLQAKATGFSSLMASQSAAAPALVRIDGSAGEPEEISVRLVSGTYFTTFGVPAAIGRTFTADDDKTEGGAPYAVLSHEFWQRRFGGRADVLNSRITLPNGVFSIIGVAPASFLGETVGERPDAWLPLVMQATVMPGRDWLHDQPNNVEKVMWLHAFGRLRPGVTLDAAQANANVVFQQGLAAYYPTTMDPNTRKGFMNQQLKLRPAATGASTLRDRFSEPLLVLLAAAGVVLLIACANVGNLMLTRTTARNRELSVRLALGATRARLIRQLLTESVLLSVVGGLAGLAAAFAMRGGLLRLVSDPRSPITLSGTLDARVLGFLFGLTIVAGLMLGLLPALRTTKTDAVTGLKEQGRGLTGSAAWLRASQLVVVAQLALSLPLLVGAGLLVRTLVNLQRADVGYAKESLLVVRVDAEPADYDASRQAAAIERLHDAISALPSVRRATYSNNGLFGGSDNGDRVIVEGYTPTGNGDRGSSYDQVGPGYFTTLGVPILLGREITKEDREGGRMVCVINERFAKRFFAGRNPIGLHVTQSYADQRKTYEVVGVVRDFRQNRLRGDIEHRYYVPATQPAASISAVSFEIRPAAGAAASVIEDVRRVVRQLEPLMRISHARPVEEAIQGRLVQDRLLARLSLAFGVVALILAAIGLYGVLSYGVARRTNEIGIRKALGAQHGTVMAMILRETGWLLVIGVIAGSALAAGAIRLIASRLYGLQPSDPMTFTLAIVILAVVAIVATWLPARRASRVDPLVALRYE